jgi:hypothetical protein
LSAARASSEAKKSAGSFELPCGRKNRNGAFRKRFSDGRAGVSFVTEERSLRRIEEIAQDWIRDACGRIRSGGARMLPENA